MKKKIIAALMAATMLVSFAACSKDSESETTAEEATPIEGEFVVGFDQEFPPMGFVDADGSYVGFDLDLAREVAKRLNKEFVAQPINWDAKDMELSSGNIDCIWNGFTMTGREDEYTWTDAYMNNAQVVVVKADSGITTLADLSGKIVCTQKDSAGLAAIDENPDLKATFAEVIEVDTFLNALMELDAGGVDAIVIDEIVARYEISTSGYNFVVLDEAVSTEEFGVGFYLGNTELRDQVQAVLEEMAEDGTLAEISIKWFGKDITTISK